MCEWSLWCDAADLAAAEAAASAAPAAGSDLENWAEREDPKSGRKYYFHKVTKVTQWAKPDGWDEHVAKQAASPAAAAAASAAPAAAGAAPAAEGSSGEYTPTKRKKFACAVMLSRMALTPLL